MDILDSKQIIIDEVNNVFQSYQGLIVENTEKVKDLIKENEILTGINNRLIKEVAEKDKLLSVNQKKFLD